MEIGGDGYVYTDEVKKKLKEEFENWRPSALQRIIWIIWPTLKLLRWRRYKTILKGHQAYKERRKRKERGHA